MPGPVSDSYPGPRDSHSSFKRGWLTALRREGFRYFVLKAADVFAALDEEELLRFNRMLAKIEMHRAKNGKVPFHSYWVYARHWPASDKVKALMEELLGHSIGEPY